MTLDSIRNSCDVYFDDIHRGKLRLIGQRFEIFEEGKLSPARPPKCILEGHLTSPKHFEPSICKSDIYVGLPGEVNIARTKLFDALATMSTISKLERIARVS